MNNSISFKEIHLDFKLNGTSYNREELKEVAYSLIKEGAPFEISIGDFLMDWLNDQEQLEVRTSGSTGNAKTIPLKKRKMVQSALTTAAFFNIKSGDTALLCLPVDYIAGKMMLVRAMVLGLELDYVPPSSQALPANKKAYDFVAMVPLQVEKSIKELNRIGTLLIGGAPISYALRRILSQKTSSVFETYGMTETITHIAARRIDQQAKVGSGFFKTLPGITVSNDSRGCLVITAPSITDKPVVTNDMVDLRSDTEFEWLGRYDNIINSGGIKLNPESIEAKLAKVINTPFVIVGLPDDSLGESVTLIIEGELNTDALQKELAQLPGLEKHEAPKRVFKVPNLVTTDNGKIQRNKTARLVQA